ncbi:MAG: HAMP domain-containing histidine kinase [Deltaproteobacteria bacterium]|nr:HAMP domain-containing histidine kinase [Deltaproteobacteria bacterium]
MKNKLKQHIAVTTVFNFLDPVLCFPSQLNQVFINLFNNAYDAMKGSGTLSVSVDSVETMVRISVLDTGTGIPEGDLQKIFNPGFTTKGVGVGTGLGLSICYRIIVEKHGGRIWAENNPTGGAAILIDLPIRGKEANAHG